jgi:hypothetical protein
MVLSVLKSSYNTDIVEYNADIVDEEVNELS